MLPWRRRRMPRSAARVPLTCPMKVTSTMRRNSASSIASNGLNAVSIAEFTQTTGVPRVRLDPPPRRVDRVAVGDVADDAEQPARHTAFELGDRLVEARAATGEHGHRVAALAEQASRRAADAGGAAGDDGDRCAAHGGRGGARGSTVLDGRLCRRRTGRRGWTDHRGGTKGSWGSRRGDRWGGR